MLQTITKALLVLIVFLPSCAFRGRDGCKGLTLDRIYFGADTPDGPVTDQMWAEFLNKEITPKFPQGLTVLEAKGQWYGANDQIVKEDSRLLELVHEGSARERQSIDQIILSYKKRFKQEAVLDMQSEVSACLK